MLARKILGIDIRKTALHTLIRKIEVDENGQLGFDFYLASNVLASTPTKHNNSAQRIIML